MTNPARQALEEPDMRTGAGQLHVSQPLAANLGEGHLDATLVTDHPTVLHPLVFSAKAFPVRYGTEDPGTKQTIAFRLKGSIINGLGLSHFTTRPGTDLLR